MAPLQVSCVCRHETAHCWLRTLELAAGCSLASCEVSATGWPPLASNRLHSRLHTYTLPWGSYSSQCTPSSIVYRQLNSNRCSVQHGPTSFVTLHTGTTLALARVFHSTTFRIIGALVSAWQIAMWLFVACMTAYHGWAGNLFHPPCLSLPASPADPPPTRQASILEDRLDQHPSVLLNTTAVRHLQHHMDSFKRVEVYCKAPWTQARLMTPTRGRAFPAQVPTQDR